MRLTIDEARDLVRAAMANVGYDEEGTQVIADHLIDSELRGYGYGGLARAVTVIERINDTPEPFRPIEVVAQTETSATVDGGDQVGYIVGRLVTDLAIAKAANHGIATVGARETWCTGMFSHYLETITDAGLIGIIASSGGGVVAPHGGTEGRYGTNPFAIGFPTDATPIIWDIGTSAAMLGEVVLAKKTGVPLADGTAIGADGRPTSDPAAALDGAILAWGGHKGSGLALAAHLLGMLAGSHVDPPWLTDMGFFVLVLDPGLLGDADEFLARAGAFAESIRATRPIDPAHPVRVPFDRSLERRRQSIAEGSFEVADEIVDALRAFAAEPVA